jgi:hypothetical protein
MEIKKENPKNVIDKFLYKKLVKCFLPLCLPNHSLVAAEPFSSNKPFPLVLVLLQVRQDAARVVNVDVSFSTYSQNPKIIDKCMTCIFYISMSVKLNGTHKNFKCG